MENKKPIDEYIIKDLPIDGQILGRNSEIRERDYTDCGDSILYPRGDGSLIIYRIGPMLGSDKCNIVELDINENLIKRDYDYSYKNIVTRDNCNRLSDNDEKECEEIGCGFNYAITEKMFKLFDNAYSEALDGLNMFISELTTEYITAGRPSSPSQQETTKFKYVLRKVSPFDSPFCIGTCLMQWDGNRITLFKLRNRKIQTLNASSTEWECTSFNVAQNRIEYLPNDTFCDCLIDAVIDNKANIFGPTKLVYYEITSGAFDNFEAIYSKCTKHIQELREMTVDVIHVMEYNK